MISVIIPVYNAEKSILQTLESVAVQTFENRELIVIDDGSTDRSLELISEFKNRYPDQNIRIFSQKNAGPSAARNTGIGKARGNWLCFVDADDRLLPEALEILYKPVKKHKPDLVCAGYFEKNPRFPNGLQLHDFPENRFNQVISKQAYQANLFSGVSGVLWAKLFKREIFETHQIRLHPEIRLSEDLLAVLEYSVHVSSVYIEEKPVYSYNRLRGAGLSGKLDYANLRDLQLTNQRILQFQQELSFLNLSEIVKKREAGFILKFLKDHSSSLPEFKKAVEFLNENFRLDLYAKFISSKIDRVFFRQVLKNNIFNAWLWITGYHFLRNIKHGIFQKRIN